MHRRKSSLPNPAAARATRRTRHPATGTHAASHARPRPCRPDTLVGCAACRAATSAPQPSDRDCPTPFGTISNRRRSLRLSIDLVPCATLFAEG